MSTQSASGPTSPSGSKTRVAIVFGGRSSEHGISCVTAGGVMRAMDPNEFEVVPIGISDSGRWMLMSDDLDRWVIDGQQLPRVKDGDGIAVSFALHAEALQIVSAESGQLADVVAEVDVVFPLLHGPYGEDGTVQGFLELSDRRYVGSGVVASAISMDKHLMKVMLSSAGIPIGPYVTVLPGRWQSSPDEVRADVEKLGFPVFVKPARAGSSMGISKVSRVEDLDAAIAEALQHDPKLVIEGHIEGREIECAVLESADGGVPSTSLPGEIEVLGGHDFYDFEAKYLDPDSVRLTCPADLPENTVAKVREMAARTFQALGCEGLARVDFFTTARGDVLVNEINTMPGFTPHSMYPRMWSATGLEYPDLVRRLVHLAAQRPVGLR